MPKPTDPSTWTHMFTDDIKFTQKITLFHPMDTDRLLVLTRSESAKVRPGGVDLPGGNVLYGEDALESILREVEEETAIVDIQPSIIHIHANMREEKGYYLIATGYRAELNQSHLNQIQLSSEHSSYHWMTKEEFIAAHPHWFLQEMIEKT